MAAGAPHCARLHRGGPRPARPGQEHSRPRVRGAHRRGCVCCGPTCLFLCMGRSGRTRAEIRDKCDLRPSATLRAKNAEGVPRHILGALAAIRVPAAGALTGTQHGPGSRRSSLCTCRRGRERRGPARATPAFTRRGARLLSPWPRPAQKEIDPLHAPCSFRKAGAAGIHGCDRRRGRRDDRDRGCADRGRRRSLSAEADTHARRHRDHRRPRLPRRAARAACARVRGAS
mmetsp:Transcript_29294/g.67190  ORF Transcript_29294/g.67190 Transcript_29294/m.67190 type:complete len:230 (+) Transcript_29294:86-775(+)